MDSLLCVGRKRAERAERADFGTEGFSGGERPVFYIILFSIFSPLKNNFYLFIYFF